jgi:hypothetical protein
MTPISPSNFARTSCLAAIAGLFLSASLLLAQIQSARASPPVLTIPIACELGSDCWVVNYFDTDPSEGASDYTGSFRTYNGHGGTDFAIRDLEAMKAGVEVLAAAPGTVQGQRDGMADINVAQIGREAVAKRECGNGVLINHDDGWSTQYCHLRKGSVRVTRGQRVAAGDVLGLVGQSGLAEFPHVHLTVRNPQGQKVDPFTTAGRPPSAATNLWDRSVLAKLAYRPTDIFAIGFRDSAPDKALAKLGTIENAPITRTSPALLFWVGMFGVHAGDRYEITLSDPDGRLIAQTEMQFEKNQARRFAWIGKRRQVSRWPPGRYVGRVTISHNSAGGTQLFSREQEIEVR